MTGTRRPVTGTRLTPLQRKLLEAVNSEPWGLTGPGIAALTGRPVHGVHETAASLVRRGLIRRTVEDRIVVYRKAG